MQSQTELRQTITNTIIEALRNGGLPPWRKPWSDDGNASGPHTSLSTGNPYRGINQILLQVAAMKHGYKSKWWGTYRQIAAQGTLVRLGQKATRIIFWKPIQKKKSNEQDQEVEESFLVMREFCVFNVEQTTGLEKFQVGLAEPQSDTAIRYENADHVIDSTGADIRYGGNEAFCNLVGDYIQLPHRHQFESPEAFYETSFHELGHWTEHPSRLDWKRADEGYAMGELIAEISACLMMAELSLPTTTNLQNHAAYLKHWLKGMVDDSRFIFRASAQASKAVDYLLSFSRKTADTLIETEEAAAA